MLRTFEKGFINRRRKDFQRIELSTFPSVDAAALNQKVRKAFKTKQSAIEFYVAGETLRSVEQKTGIHRRHLYRLLERCLAQNDDGRINGFRGLLANGVTRNYTRIKGTDTRIVGGSRGMAGALHRLIESYPVLSSWIRNKIRDRRVVLHQSSTDDRLRVRVSGITALHHDFLNECRGVGLSAADYPFTMKRMALGSLTRLIKGELLRNFGQAARSAGAKRLKGLPRDTPNSGAPAPVRPMEVVEFDAHRLDIRLKIVVKDPLGFEQEFEINRVWILVIIDVYTRAVLGYHVSLEREYNRYDVIRTIEKTLETHRPKQFTLPGIGYNSLSGFPSGKLPELAYATWQWIKLDNAKANLAQDTMHALCDFIGCFVDAGPTYNPDERPYIERFFGTLASTVSSRLPGYTGSHPKDLRRAISDPKGDLRLFVSLTELEELLEVSIADYNATPHAGLHSRTPLEVTHFHIRGQGAILNWLPEAKRRTLCLMQTPRILPVRGYIPQGIRPHVNFHGVRYSNTVLASSASLIGRRLRIYYNSQDLRTIRTFLDSGEELGTLKAQGAWGEFAHDLKLRQEIMRARGSKRLKTVIDHTFLSKFVQDKLAAAKKSRRAASDFARTVKLLATAPTAHSTTREVDLSTQASNTSDTKTPPVGPNGDVLPVDSGKNTPASPIEPYVLSIGTGYSG